MVIYWFGNDIMDVFEKLEAFDRLVKIVEKLLDMFGFSSFKAFVINEAYKNLDKVAEIDELIKEVYGVKNGNSVK